MTVPSSLVPNLELQSGCCQIASKVVSAKHPPVSVGVLDFLSIVFTEKELINVDMAGLELERIGITVRSVFQIAAICSVVSDWGTEDC